MGKKSERRDQRIAAAKERDRLAGCHRVPGMDANGALTSQDEERPAVTPQGRAERKARIKAMSLLAMLTALPPR